MNLRMIWTGKKHHKFFGEDEIYHYITRLEYALKDLANSDGCGSGEYCGTAEQANRYWDQIQNGEPFEM